MRFIFAILFAMCAAPSFAGSVSQAGTTTRLIPQTVASLPTCNTSAAGQQAYVTNALSPTFLATVASGGAVVVPVFCNGSAWIVH